MAFKNAVTGTAFAVLNEILGTYHGTDGIARPSRYEVILIFYKPSLNFREGLFL